MTTLTLKRKKQVYTVNGGKVADSSVKPEKVAKEPKAKPEAKAKPSTREKAGEAVQPKKKNRMKPVDPTKIPPLIEHWPELFTESEADIKPLKIGIFKDLVAEKTIKYGHLKKGISAYISRPAYWQKIIDGDCRYDKEGKPSGEILDKHREHARQKIKSYRKWQENLGSEAQTEGSKSLEQA